MRISCKPNDYCDTRLTSCTYFDALDEFLGHRPLSSTKGCGADADLGDELSLKILNVHPISYWCMCRCPHSSYITNWS